MTTGPAAPVLAYSNLGPERTAGQLDPALLPFASGAFLPFAVLALVVRETWPIGIGLSVTWGEAGALLLALKIRRKSIRPRPIGRPWWTAVAAGVANSVAVFAIVKLTTAREPFWPFLGEGGSILVALALAGIVAVILAMILVPRA